MNILFWAGGFWPRIGGTETYSLQLIEAMRERGHQYMVLAHQFDDCMKEDEDCRGIPIKRFAFDAMLAGRDPKNIRLVQKYLEEVIEQFRPDVVHLNMALGWGSLLFLLCRSLFSIPIILTVHSSYFRQGKKAPLVEKIFSAVDRICCVSDWIFKEIEMQIPAVKDKLQLIYNGVLLPEIAPTPLPFSPPVLLLLGRLSLEKGFDTALQAFCLLKKSGSRAQLLIAGEGPEGASLQRLASDLGEADSVQFIGKVSREAVPALINRATLVMIPSYFEAFGLVALEAMQMNRPVIASRVGGLPEIVSDQETGLLVSPRDPLVLCRAMQELLGQPEKAKEMGRQGRRKAVGFSLHQSAAAYEILFSQMMGNRV